MNNFKRICKFSGIIFYQYLIFIFSGVLFSFFTYFVLRRYGDAFLIQQKLLKLFLEHLICWFIAINASAYLAMKITSFKKFILMECWLTGFTIAIGLFSLLDGFFTLADNIACIAGLLTALVSFYYYSSAENIFKET